MQGQRWPESRATYRTNESKVMESSVCPRISDLGIDVHVLPFSLKNFEHIALRKYGLRSDESLHDVWPPVDLQTPESKGHRFKTLGIRAEYYSPTPLTQSPRIIYDRVAKLARRLSKETESLIVR